MIFSIYVLRDDPKHSAIFDRQLPDLTEPIDSYDCAAVFEVGAEVSFYVPDTLELPDKHRHNAQSILTYTHPEIKRLWPSPGIVTGHTIRA